MSDFTGGVVRSRPVLPYSVVPTAHDAFACAGVPERELHLRVCLATVVPLHALGTLYSRLSSLGVSVLRYT